MMAKEVRVAVRVGGSSVKACLRQEDVRGWIEIDKKI
jgi:hypothetical protein